jgi:hypothetical protein
MAISVSFFWPVTTPPSSTPPPTNQQPPSTPTGTGRFNTVVVELDGDSSTTTVTITHNLQLTALELGQQLPEVQYEPLVSGAPSHWVAARTTNNVTVSFSATSSVTFGLLRIRRPVAVAK